MEPLGLTTFLGIFLVWLLILICRDLLMILAGKIVDSGADLGQSLAKLGKKTGDSIARLIKGVAGR